MFSRRVIFLLLYNYATVYTKGKVWITFPLCGKERMFVEKSTRFYQNRSHFLGFYPRNFFF